MDKNAFLNKIKSIHFEDMSQNERDSLLLEIRDFNQKNKLLPSENDFLVLIFQKIRLIEDQEREKITFQQNERFKLNQQSQFEKDQSSYKWDEIQLFSNLSNSELLDIYKYRFIYSKYNEWEWIQEVHKRKLTKDNQFLQMLYINCMTKQFL